MNSSTLYCQTAEKLTLMKKDHRNSNRKPASSKTGSSRKPKAFERRPPEKKTHAFSKFDRNVKDERTERILDEVERKRSKPRKEKPFRKKGTSLPPKVNYKTASGEGMRLNKYVAHCGICSRRQAAEYVKAGWVAVNGEVVDTPAYVVKASDKVTYKGDLIRPEERKVYILLNKPRNVITTVSDDRGRRTVVDIVAERVDQRVFPVGRLDRDTTGLLLLTNDGALTKKLSHPSHEVKKFYQATLNRKLRPEDMQAIVDGLELEDGKAVVDSVGYVREREKNVIGLELHSGRNRIVRHIFEHLGYEVERLDRTYYAGLTKKDLPRGRFRELTDREVIMLKHFS